MWFGYVFVFNNAACEQDEKTPLQLLIDFHQGSAYIRQQKKKSQHAKLRTMKVQTMACTGSVKENWMPSHQGRMNTFCQSQTWIAKKVTKKA